MKRQQTENTSFELFLDTICNTFGGIVFLAILLAIMIQTRAVVKTDGTDQQPPTPDEVRELIVQLDALDVQHANLAEALKNTPASVASPDDSVHQELAAQLDQLTDELTEVTAQQASTTRDLAKLLAQNARLEDENARVPAELKAAQTEVADKSAALQNVLADQQQTLQLPRVQRSSASSVLLLMQSDRVFMALQPSVFGQDFNGQHVTTRSLANGGIEVTPKPGAGWSTQTPDGRGRIKEVVRRAATNGNIISIAVWPDSYGEFGEVKAGMVTSGVGYQLWPQQEDEPLIVFTGSGASSVQ